METRVQDLLPRVAVLDADDLMGIVLEDLACDDLGKVGRDDGREERVESLALCRRACRCRFLERPRQ